MHQNGAALCHDFLSFVNASPSPFHAVLAAKERLLAAGFVELKEKLPWTGSDVRPSGKYFFTRNQSSIVAFAVGGKYTPTAGGISIVAAHTDSPCLKLKPVSRRESNGYLQVGVQLYGGGLWHTWFDRDLSVAGRVIVEGSDGALESHLVRVNKSLLRVPTLAIHLDRSVNDGFKFNNESQLLPILATSIKDKLSRKVPATTTDAATETAKPAHHEVLTDLLARELNVKAECMKDFELCLYDTQPAALGGVYDEFVFSPRLDNLMMSFCSLQALLASAHLESEPNIRLVALFDNEEVGSESAHGAGSNLLEATIRRLSTFDGKNYFDSIIHKSFLISADMAHAIHPNYSEKHEMNHQPAMHKGIVIKNNANQRYATTAVTSCVLKTLASKNMKTNSPRSIPVQEFVVRNDSPCGSTIGPILSAKLGLRTADVGNPQLSMHSIREMCGVDDIKHATDLFEAFFNEFPLVDAKLNVD